MEWSDAEIKLFINNKGLFNLYVINYCLKSCLLTPLIMFTTPIPVALNDLPLIAKLPLPINVVAPPINTTAPSINALNTQPIEAKAIINYSRDLATLIKIYIKESKYSRENNNFNYKLTIFYNLYNRVNIPQAAKIKGFLIILYSIIFNFYYRNKITYVTFNNICNTIYNYFKGLEYKCGVLTKWNAITLKIVIIKNKGKSIEDCL